MENDNDKYITDMFAQTDIPTISESEIKALCDMTAQYLPAAKRKVSLWEIVWLEICSKSFIFWSACTAIMVGCVILINFSHFELSALRIVAVAAPLPLLIGIIELLKNRNPAVSELEMVCKYNISQLHVVKLLIGLACNIIVLSVVAIANLGQNGGILSLLFTGFTVMFFIGFVALGIASKIGQSLPIIGLLAGWVLVGSILCSDGFLTFVSVTSLYALASVMLFSMALFAIEMYAFPKQSCFFKIGDIEI